MKNMEKQPDMDFRMKYKTGIICSKCGSDDIRPYMYGLPAPIGFKYREAGLLVLGGCMVYPDNPDYRCNNCKTDFKSADDTEKALLDAYYERISAIDPDELYEAFPDKELEIPEFLLDRKKVSLHN